MLSSLFLVLFQYLVLYLFSGRGWVFFVFIFSMRVCTYDYNGHYSGNSDDKHHCADVYPQCGVVQTCSTQEEIHTFDKNSRIRQEELDRKLAEASAKAKTALDTARADAVAAGDEKLAAVKAKAEADKNKKMTALKKEVEAAGKGLHDNLSGFADDMAGKILGRSL